MSTGTDKPIEPRQYGLPRYQWLRLVAANWVTHSPGWPFNGSDAEAYVTEVTAEIAACGGFDEWYKRWREEVGRVNG